MKGQFEIGIRTRKPDKSEWRVLVKLDSGTEIFQYANRVQTFTAPVLAALREQHGKDFEPLPLQ